jgi:hypothetical protein
LVGASELAEIAVIVATELDVEIVAVIDNSISKPRLLGIPVIAQISAAANSVDAVLITGLSEPQSLYASAVGVFGAKRVYMPSVLANMVAGSSQPAGSRKGRPQK